MLFYIFNCGFVVDDVEESPHRGAQVVGSHGLVHDASESGANFDETPRRQTAHEEMSGSVGAVKAGKRAEKGEEVPHKVLWSANGRPAGKAAAKVATGRETVPAKVVEGGKKGNTSKEVKRKGAKELKGKVDKGLRAKDKESVEGHEQTTVRSVQRGTPVGKSDITEHFHCSLSSFNSIIFHR